MLLNECVHKKKEWSVVSRSSTKRLLMDTVVYVITDIPLLFGQSQPFVFKKNGLQKFKEKAREMIS